MSTNPTDESRATQQRQRICRAAAELFDRSGYHETSLDEIAAAVGLRKPTLYHYFKSKDEILFLIHDEFIELLLSKHRARLKHAMPPRVRLLEMMTDMFEVIDTHRGHVRVFFEHFRELPAEQRREIASKRDQFQKYVEDEMARAIATCEFRELDPRLSALAFFGMCNWAYQWFRSDGPLLPGEIASLFGDIFFHGVEAYRAPLSR